MLALRRTQHRVLAVSVLPPNADVVSHLAARGIVVDVLRAAELRRAG
jgi:hypothetical protein